MERSCRRLAPAIARVIPFGYTERVPDLMAASDVVVTSSGDTCREARTLGRGIVLLDVVPGHGRENLMHELELGGATVCMPTPDSIARAVRSFVGDPARSRVPPAPDGPDAGAGPVRGRPVQGLGFELWAFWSNRSSPVPRSRWRPGLRRAGRPRVVSPHPKCHTGRALSWMESMTSPNAFEELGGVLAGDGQRREQLEDVHVVAGGLGQDAMVLEQGADHHLGEQALAGPWSAAPTGTAAAGSAGGRTRCRSAGRGPAPG